MKQIYYIAAIVAAFAPLALGESPDYHTNNREKCRSAVAGLYLNLFDECRRNTDLVKITESKLKDLEVLSQSKMKLLSALEKKAAGEFDIATSRSLEEAKGAASLITSQIDDMRIALTTAKTLSKTCHQEEKKLSQAMAPVFKTDKTGDYTLGAYPFRTEFKSPCPPMRALCPLPRQDALKLKEFVAAYNNKDRALDACERYASYTNIP